MKPPGGSELGINIKMWLKNYGVDCIELAQDVHWWSYYVSMVMNLLVPEKSRH